MTAVPLIRDAMTELLRRHDIEAISAFPDEMRKCYDTPVVLVSLKEVQSESAGFQQYLGERFQEDRQAWEEVYGQKIKVCFGLDIYSPRSYGEHGTQEMMDRLTNAFGKETPAGLSLTELSWKGSNYNRSCNMFQRGGEALCEGLLYLVKDPDGSFLSFEVRGGITLELPNKS